MPRPNLAELKARYKSLSEQKQTSSNNYDNDVFPFFNAAPETESEVRLLADTNEENPLVFQIERFTHALPINGKIQKGIPCIAMYGVDCPICERSVKYYKVARDLKENTKSADGPLGPNAAKGKLYWRNKDSIARGLVLKDPLPVEEGKESHLGKTRTLYLTGSVIDRVIGDLSSFGDNESPPWDLENGVNFIFRKTMKGSQANYATSGFARRSSPIPEEYKSNVKLVDLKSLLPANPGLEKILALLEAHDTGKEVAESSSQSVKTSQVSTPAVKTEEKIDGDDSIPFDAKTTIANTVIKTETVVTEPVKSVKEEVKPADPEEDDILARIKNRNKNKS